MEKNVANMTIDEFSNYLSELNHRVTHYYEYEKTVKDKRKDAKNTRSYSNAQRGNFYGGKQTTAVKELKQLNKLVKEQFDVY